MSTGHKQKSLRFELLYDLSLLTFCAVILGCGLLILLLRFNMPDSFSGHVGGYLNSLHSQFLESEEYKEALSRDEPDSYSRAFEAFKFKALGLPEKELAAVSLSELKNSRPQGNVEAEYTHLWYFLPKVTAFTLDLPGGDQQVFRYRFSIQFVHDILTKNKNIVLFLSFIITSLLVFIGYHLLFRKNILIPIKNLSDTANAFLAEDWNFRVRVQRRDELGEIGEALNEMAKRIQDKEKKLVLSIESLKSANEELEMRKNEQLQIEKLASVGRLAAGVAHEVGNPLGAISGYVDILRRAIEKSGDLTSEDTELCDRIEAETNRISKIIRALLQQARPPQDRIRPVSLMSLMERSVELAQIPSNITVQFEFENPEAEALAEKDQLIQVCLNLLINAKHAVLSKMKMEGRTEGGKITVRCGRRKLPHYNQKDFAEDNLLDTSVVRALKPQTYQMLSIVDNGTGITKEDRQKLFEPFFTTKGTGKGTGLGLYVAKSIIESFRGTIAVQSSPGYGASFSIFLPMSV